MYGAIAFLTGKLSLVLSTFIHGDVWGHCFHDRILDLVLSMCVYSSVWGHCFLGRENHSLVVLMFTCDNVCGFAQHFLCAAAGG